MSTPVLPISFSADAPGIVPTEPAHNPTNVTGPPNDRENAAKRRQRKKKKQQGLNQDPPVSAPEDPKGKQVNILA